MILSVSAQASVFLWFAAAGAAAGLLFDVFRAMRRVQPHSNALTQVEDVLYWLSVFLLVMYLLLTRNSGELRGFIFLGFALGLVLYFSACSHLALLWITWLMKAVKRVFSTVLMVLTWPIRFLRRVLHTPVVKCRKFLKKYTVSVKKSLHKARIYGRIRVTGVLRDIHVLRKKM